MLIRNQKTILDEKQILTILLARKFDSNSLFASVPSDITNLIIATTHELSPDELKKETLNAMITHFTLNMKNELINICVNYINDYLIIPNQHEAIANRFIILLKEICKTADVSADSKLYAVILACSYFHSHLSHLGNSRLTDSLCKFVCNHHLTYWNHEGTLPEYLYGKMETSPVHIDLHSYFKRENVDDKFIITLMTDLYKKCEYIKNEMKFENLNSMKSYNYSETTESLIIKLLRVNGYKIGQEESKAICSPSNS